MKVIVTGATGFVGQHVIPCLLDQGHEVLAIARNESRARLFPWYGKVRFIAFDIYSDPDRLVSHIGPYNVLLHLAWSGLPNYTSLFHFEQNLPADYLFLKTMVLAGVNQVLVTGTCLEYGMKNGALSENSHTKPNNPYGFAKDTLRKYLEYLKKDHAFILKWARLFYMYGPGQNSKSLISQLDIAVSKGQKEFPMSGGEQLRDYSPVETVAKYLVALIEKEEFDGILNICSGKPISVRRFVEEYLAQKDVKIKLNLGVFPYPDYEPFAFWGEHSKLQKLLGIAS